jgi:hypothetical protein
MGEKTTVFTLRLPSALATALRVRAEVAGVPMADIIRAAIAYQGHPKPPYVTIQAGCADAPLTVSTDVPLTPVSRNWSSFELIPGPDRSTPGENRA